MDSGMKAIIILSVCLVLMSIFSIVMIILYGNKQYELDKLETDIMVEQLKKRGKRNGRTKIRNK